MTTPYSKVFSSFLGKLQDDIYPNYWTPEAAEEDMVTLLNSGLVHFEYPKIDVTKKDDTKQEFTENLGFYEIEILANLMKLEWIKRQIFSIDLIKQKLSDRDFKFTSQAAHLQSLLMLKNDTAKDIEELKTKYSYRSTIIPKPDYSGLSGSD